MPGNAGRGGSRRTQPLPTAGGASAAGGGGSPATLRIGLASLSPEACLFPRSTLPNRDSETNREGTTLVIGLALKGNFIWRTGIGRSLFVVVEMTV